MSIEAQESASAAGRPPVRSEQDAAIVAKAALRAAELLDVKAREFAAIVGLSEASVSRLRQGAFRLEPNGKSFELALLFARLFRSLDAIAGGDQAVARAWLRADNRALDGCPLEKIQTIAGLIDVIAYLDARRAAL